MGVGETHMQDSLKCQEKTSAWSPVREKGTNHYDSSSADC